MRRISATGICQWLVLVLCFILVFSGRHPPAFAQQAPSAPAEVYGLEIRANGIDGRIDDLKAKIEAFDGKQVKMWEAINANTTAEATNKGIIMGVGALLGILQVFSILQNMNRRPGSQKKSEE